MPRSAVASLIVLLSGLFPCVSSTQSLLLVGDAPAQIGAMKPLAANLSGPASPPAEITIPAGTRVMMALRSPLHTTSGTEGSGLYLETLYPVIQGDRVVIPAHTQVQGDVERNQRPGHLRRVSEFKFRFTSLIFPNNHVAAIEGALQSIPGSKTTRAERSDGTLRTVDQTEKVVTPAAAGAVTGAIAGSVQHTGIGTYVGGGLGAALGLGAVLLHRGDAIDLPRGTNVEMVLASPLVLEPEQAAFNAQYVPPPQARSNDARSNSYDEQQSPRRPRPRLTPFPWPWPVR